MKNIYCIRHGLALHNVLGQEIKILVNGVKEYGYHTITWNGKNNLGREMASGVYFHG